VLAGISNPEGVSVKRYITPGSLWLLSVRFEPLPWNPQEVSCHAVPIVRFAARPADSR
jgi:hypothetical protein